MRAAVYARVSTTDQAEEGHSIDEQVLAILRYCESKRWQVVDRYVDRGVSGSTGKRPELRRLLADAQTERFDVVVCHAVDRFYRNLQGLLKALEQLNRADVSFVSITENMDFTTPWGKLTLAVLGSLAEVFLDKLSTATAKGKQGRARSGLNNASQPAYGYARNEEGLDVIDPDVAPAVVLAFEAYETGNHTDTTIANLLNRKGYKPSGRARSGLWTREGVRYMLTNPFYLGKVKHGGDLCDGNHQPLIDRELFDRVQVMRTRRNLSRGGRRRSDRVYLLADLAVCSGCGLRLVSQTSTRPGRRDIQQYLCPSRRRSIACDAGKHITPADAIDAQVADLIGRLRLPANWRERLQELADHRDERDRAEGRRKYLRGKLRRLRELYLEGDFDRREYTQRKAELQSQLDALQVPESPAVEEAGETLESLRTEWANAPKRIKHEMLKVIFETIYIDIEGRRLVCVKAWPPFLPLFRMDGLQER